MSGVKIFASLKHLPWKNILLGLGALAVTLMVQGLGWPINGPSVLGFWSVVVSALYNNGKYGFNAVHGPTFWLTAVSAVLLFLKNGLGWHPPSTLIYGVAASLIGLVFHMAHSASATALTASSGTTASAPTGGQGS